MCIRQGGFCCSAFQPANKVKLCYSVELGPMQAYFVIQALSINTLHFFMTFEASVVPFDLFVWSMFLWQRANSPRAHTFHEILRMKKKRCQFVCLKWTKTRLWYNYCSPTLCNIYKYSTKTRFKKENTRRLSYGLKWVKVWTWSFIHRSSAV